MAFQPGDAAKPENVTPLSDYRPLRGIELCNP
jgi:hypothetical protein